MEKIKKNKKKLYSFRYLKKSKNDLNDFYNEWERFQKITRTVS